jgi:hypothetical protein
LALVEGNSPQADVSLSDRSFDKFPYRSTISGLRFVGHSANVSGFNEDPSNAQYLVSNLIPRLIACLVFSDQGVQEKIGHPFFVFAVLAAVLDDELRRASASRSHRQND